MAAAYFACVNANGGIKGHPVQLNIETEAINPVQATAAAKKLIGSQHVVGMVGNTSIIECTVNHKYYEQQGFYVIASGIAPECYGTSNIASVNMGPRYSSTAPRSTRSSSTSTSWFDQSNAGHAYNVGGVR